MYGISIAIEGKVGRLNVEFIVQALEFYRIMMANEKYLWQRRIYTFPCNCDWILILLRFSSSFIMKSSKGIFTNLKR